MTLPLPACLYLVNSLDNTPAALTALLSPLPTNDPIWDTSPDPDRFPLREIVAHLADWEDVWRERLERTLIEDNPLIPRPDINQRAEKQGYADADPQESLAHFQERRVRLTTWLRSLPTDAWSRPARFDRMGDLTMDGLVALALAHDSYHVRQISEWLAAD
ncbi:MAG: DinB family protein [Cytophagales bacterium]|nr:DinB family protein [Armatimonadota bacterium]